MKFDPKIQKSDHGEEMHVNEKGVESDSELYFHTPSPTARRLLYFPVAVGRYSCNEAYCVRRERFDSFLGLYLLDGEMTLELNRSKTTAKRGELLLVDCYHPHTYYTESGAKTLWIHFDGSESRKWFEEIIAVKGQKFSPGEAAIQMMEQMFDSVRRGFDEYEISSQIYTFLCSMATQNNKSRSDEKQAAVQMAEDYIRTHFNQPLTVASIAAQTHFSMPYFNKLFRAVTGLSPYDYLLKVRLEKAKKLLFQTELPIPVVAEQTGFNSTSNFLFFFKKQTGFSALKFRKLRF